VNRNAIIAVVATFFITALLGYLFSTYERGTQALTEDQIKKVLKESQVTYINGEERTYGEALSSLSTNQAVIISKLETNTRALEALAAE